MVISNCACTKICAQTYRSLVKQCLFQVPEVSYEIVANLLGNGFNERMIVFERRVFQNRLEEMLVNVLVCRFAKAPTTRAMNRLKRVRLVDGRECSGRRSSIAECRCSRAGLFCIVSGWS